MEADAPCPLVPIGRRTGAHDDGTDEDIAVVDQPSRLVGIWVSAAGEGGYGPIISPIRPEVKALGRWRPRAVLQHRPGPLPSGGGPKIDVDRHRRSDDLAELDGDRVQQLLLFLDAGRCT